MELLLHKHLTSLKQLLLVFIYHRPTWWTITTTSTCTPSGRRQLPGLQPLSQAVNAAASWRSAHIAYKNAGNEAEAVHGLLSLFLV